MLSGTGELREEEAVGNAEFEVYPVEKTASASSAGAVVADGILTTAVLGAPSASIKIAVSTGTLVSLGTGISLEEGRFGAGDHEGRLMLWPTELQRETANAMVAVIPARSVFFTLVLVKTHLGGDLIKKGGKAREKGEKKGILVLCWSASLHIELRAD